MNLFAGLEKFGLGQSGEFDITKEEPKKAAAAQPQAAEPKALPKETDFLIDKKMRCPICDKEFPIKSVATTRLKKLESDFDLRPNFAYIDQLKYDAIFCPNCGYTAMTANFPKIEPARAKLIKQEISANFKPVREELRDTYSYEYAIEKMKLALVCCMAKKAKMSEKAYCCLKLAWLRRAQLKKIEKAGDQVNPELAQVARQEYDAFYSQAYEGFLKAMETETPPFNGIPSTSLEYMIVNMAVELGHLDVAGKLVSKLITNPNTPSALKDKCRDIKDEIAAKQQ